MTNGEAKSHFQVCNSVFAYMSLNRECRLDLIFRSARVFPPLEPAAFPESACGKMPNCAGKPARCLPRANKASRLPNIAQKFGHV